MNWDEMSQTEHDAAIARMNRERMDRFEWAKETEETLSYPVRPTPSMRRTVLVILHEGAEAALALPATHRIDIELREQEWSPGKLIVDVKVYQHGRDMWRASGYFFVGRHGGVNYTVRGKRKNRLTASGKRHLSRGFTTPWTY